MKRSLLLLALTTLGFGATHSLRAADESESAAVPGAATAPAPAEQSPILADLGALFDRVKAKVAAAGEGVESSALAAELAEFEAIIAKHPDAKPEEKAGVLWMKARLQLEVFEDFAQAEAIVRRFKTEYPTTAFAEKSDEILAAIAQDRKATELRRSLGAGGVFPGLEGKTLDGAVVSTQALQGKVVLVDFWATWCPPCREELPHVIAAYKKYHAKGFEVIGVSLDHDEDTLRKFVAGKQMPWAQIYEGASELAEKFGVETIPTTYLIGPDGRIVTTDLRGDDLETKLAALLGGT